MRKGYDYIKKINMIGINKTINLMVLDFCSVCAWSQGVMCSSIYDTNETKQLLQFKYFEKRTKALETNQTASFDFGF